MKEPLSVGSNADQERTYFLSVSNGRTGSTWLETSLGILPNVAIDYEFKWHPTNYEPLPHHMVIKDRSFSCIRTFDAFSDDAGILGSKLVLDPHTFLKPEVIDTLSDAIEKKVAIIHLARDYFDIFISFEARNTYNLFRAGDENRLQGTRLHEAMKKGSKTHNSEQRKVNIVRGYLDRKLLDFKCKYLGTEPTAIMPFDVAVEKLLILFYNDLIALELAANAERSMAVHYREIPERFPDVAKYIGITDTEAIKDVQANPVTRKLENLPSELIRHMKTVRRVATCLDEARNFAVSSRARLVDFWEWGPDFRLAKIRVRGLKRAVQRGLTLLPKPLIGKEDYLEWPCRWISP